MRNFEAKDKEQISVVEGQQLIVISKEGYKEGWLKVRTENKEVNLYTCIFTCIFYL